MKIRYHLVAFAAACLVTHAAVAQTTEHPGVWLYFDNGGFTNVFPYPPGDNDNPNCWFMEYFDLQGTADSLTEINTRLIEVAPGETKNYRDVIELSCPEDGRNGKATILQAGV